MDQTSSKDSFSSFLPQQDQNSQYSLPESPTISRPALSLSPNSQLTMSLINNLIQMHGLENSIVQQPQLTTTTPSSSSGHGSNTSNQSSRTPYNNSHLLLEQQIKLTQLQQLQHLQNQIFQQQIALISGQSPPILPTSPAHGSTNAAVTGEQTFPGLPTPAPSGEIRPQQPPIDFVSPIIGAGYLEPLPHSMIPSSSQSPSPTVQQHMRHSSTGSNRQLQALSHQQQQGSSYPPSPTTFQQNVTSPIFQPTSPLHQPVSPLHQPVSSSHHFGGNNHHHHHHHQREIYQRQQQREFRHHHQSGQMNNAHSHSASTTTTTTTASTPISTPRSSSERIAFNIYTGGGGSIPGLTLGPPGGPLEDRAISRASSVANVAPGELAHGSAGGGGGGDPNSTTASPNHTSVGFAHMQILDQDISPLTSPWLGAASQSSVAVAAATTTTGGQNPNSTSRRSSASMGVPGMSGSNKRTASESGDEGGSARKKQSPAIRPVLDRLTSSTCLSSSSLSKEKQREDDREGGKRRGGSSSPQFGLIKEMSSPMSPTEGLPPPLTIENNLGRGGGVSGGRRNSRSPVIEGPTLTSNSVRKSRRGSKSMNSTPLLRSTPSNMLGGTTTTGSSTGSNSGTRGKNRSSYALTGATTTPITTTTTTIGEDVRDSPSPVDLNLDVQDSRAMPPPPLPASASGVGSNGMDVDIGGGGGGGAMSSTVDDNNNNNHNHDAHTHGIMGMGGMTFEGMMGLEGMSGGGLVGMGDMGDMGIGVGMDMHGMGIDAMGMGSFGSDAMGIMDMDFGGGGTRQQQQQQEQQQQLQLPSSTTTSPGGAKLNQHSIQQQQQQSTSTMPVATPASMLNLGRLGGGRLGNSSGSGSGNPGTTTTNSQGVMTRAQKHSRSTSNLGKEFGSAANVSAPGKSAAGVKTRRSNLVSPGLKPLRPAGSGTFSSNAETASSSPLSGPSKAAGGPGSSSSGAIAGTGTLPESAVRQPKRTHRDAEQRRRNSQKQVIDELRRLLPPIALPNDSTNGGDLDPTMTSPFFFHPTAPLLPGGLPPRGPPKAGAEGPNKNVSKLQVLLCGNEYIKMLKTRVDRRDEEIGRLRREIRRLRLREGGFVSDVNGGCEEEMIDLEKDLDAVEKLNMIAAKAAVNGGGLGVVAVGAGDDAMDEDDEDGDD